jgi:hypothetical protein
MRMAERGSPMPVLMVALIALVVFGVVGILLLTAVILETRMKRYREGTPILDATPTHSARH